MPVKGQSKGQSKGQPKQSKEQSNGSQNGRRSPVLNRLRVAHKTAARRAIKELFWPC